MGIFLFCVVLNSHWNFNTFFGLSNGLGKKNPSFELITTRNVDYNWATQILCKTKRCQFLRHYFLMILNVHPNLILLDIFIQFQCKIELYVPSQTKNAMEGLWHHKRNIFCIPSDKQYAKNLSFLSSKIWLTISWEEVIIVKF